LSSLFGRFTSPDNAADQGPNDPQSWNLYGYVRNNPMSNMDPDGHDCVVQTRTGDHSETVTVSSGTCDKVKVGDGQTKTYIPGTVKQDTITSNGHGGITFGYTPYDGGTGVGSLDAAPVPDRRGLAYGYNAGGYRTLGVAGATMTDARTYAIWTAASAFVGYGIYSAGWIGTGVEGFSGEIAAGEAVPTANQVAAVAKEAALRGGRKGVEAFLRGQRRALAEHLEKLARYRGEGGYTSSVERTIKNCQQLIRAAEDWLSKHP
jgi:hypothetical protein